jgi:hypothetical protein
MVARVLMVFGAPYGALVSVLLVARAAPAAIVLSIDPITSNVTSGSTGNAFDVTLTSDTTVTIAAFSFGLSVGGSDITFTDVTTGTSNPYIFAGQSTFGPDIAFPSAPSASDLYDVPGSGATIAPDTTVALGRVFFDVAASAPNETITVSFDPFATSLSDPDGNSLDFSSTSGQINVTSPAGSTIPEPRAVVVWCILAVLGCAVRIGPTGIRFRRRCAQKG